MATLFSRILHFDFSMNSVGFTPCALNGLPTGMQAQSQSQSPLTILSLRWLWAVSGAMVRPKFNPGLGFGWVWVGFGRLWGVTGPILNPVLMMKAKFQPRPRLWLG